MKFEDMDNVEIIAIEEGLQGSLHPAIILHRMPGQKYMVQYKNQVYEKNRKKLLEEAVHEHRIVPEPPPGVYRRFIVGDEVDVLDKGCCWWSGKNAKVYRNYYAVTFDGYRGVYYYSPTKIRPSYA